MKINSELMVDIDAQERPETSFEQSPRPKDAQCQTLLFSLIHEQAQLLRAS